MDQLTRIEKLLERIAVALEKQESPAVSYLPITQPWDWNWDKWVYNPGPQCGSDAKFKYSTDTTHLRQRFGVDYSMVGDECRVPDRCEARFDTMMNFGVEPHIPDDRHLTKEEAHALNRAVKRSTIKAHGGKLEKD